MDRKEYIKVLWEKMMNDKYEVCKGWQSFAAFYKWAEPRCSIGDVLTLDLIKKDNTTYKPSMCLCAPDFAVKFVKKNPKSKTGIGKRGKAYYFSVRHPVTGDSVLRSGFKTKAEAIEGRIKMVKDHAEDVINECRDQDMIELIETVYELDDGGADWFYMEPEESLEIQLMDAFKECVGPVLNNFYQPSIHGHPFYGCGFTLEQCDKYFRKWFSGRWLESMDVIDMFRDGLDPQGYFRLRFNADPRDYSRYAVNVEGFKTYNKWGY